MIRSTLAKLSLSTIAVVMLCGATPADAAVRRQVETSTDPTGLLFTSPARVEEDVTPGQTTTIRMRVFNDDDTSIDVSLSTSDLGPSANPQSLAAPTEKGEFGAGTWIEPEIRDFRLKPFESISFDVRVTPPLTAPIGTNAGAVIVSGNAANGKIGTDGDPTGSVAIDTAVQMFATVPGPVQHDLHIRSIHTRDAFLLGSHRFVVWDVTFTNGGTVNEHVNGSLSATSIFGNSAFRGKIDDIIVLRNSKRTARVIWEDPPWIGRFSPTVNVRGDDAKLVTRTGSAVTVIPWWVPVIVAMLVVFPFLFLWMRRRQDWKHYLEDGDDDDLDDGFGYDDADHDESIALH